MLRVILYDHPDAIWGNPHPDKEQVSESVEFDNLDPAVAIVKGRLYLYSSDVADDDDAEPFAVYNKGQWTGYEYFANTEYTLIKKPDVSSNLW